MIGVEVYAITTGISAFAGLALGGVGCCSAVAPTAWANPCCCDVRVLERWPCSASATLGLGHGRGAIRLARTTDRPARLVAAIAAGGLPAFLMLLEREASDRL